MKQIVSISHWGMRIGCHACGVEIGKFVMYGRAEGDDQTDLCRSCCEAGEASVQAAFAECADRHDLISSALRMDHRFAAEALAIEQESARDRFLADSRWELPSSADFERYESDNWESVGTIPLLSVIDGAA